MKEGFLHRSLLCLLVLGALPLFNVSANPVNLVSLAGVSSTAVTGGNGDSGPAVISPDGRYILFSSAANNLALTTNGAPVAVTLPAHTAVYLRDRTNHMTTLVSVNLAGISSGNGDAFADGISSNGQYALFESSAMDLVNGYPGTNSLVNVFLRDVQRGTNILMSTSTNGGFGNGNSSRATMTPDGRFVAFVSSASNLVAGDTNAIPDIFVRDLLMGTTTLVSVSATSTGTNAGSYSAAPQITPDGRFVEFFSTATNLVPGVTNIGDIYVRDLANNVTYWASASGRTQLQAALGTSNGICFSPKMSGDGSTVAFEISATNFAKTNGVVLRYNLVSGTTDIVNTNANAPVGIYEDLRALDMSPDGRFVATVVNTDTKGINTAIYLWDAYSGTNNLVTADINNAVAGGSSYAPVIDASGRYVAFLSQATNLTTNLLSGDCHLYVRDMQGATTVLIDANNQATGVGVNVLGYPTLSEDATLLAYESSGFGNRNEFMDVFARQLTANVTELISVQNPAISNQAPDGASYFSSTIPLSASGQYVVFSSEADNLVTNDLNGFSDVFVRDQNANTTILVSADTNGLPAAGVSAEASISSDGRYVAFSSSAATLVSGDTNNCVDVFRRDLQTGITALVSVNTNGTGPGNSNSYAPLMSSDGRFVLFRSQAQNLAVGAFGNGIENLFLRDLQLNKCYALTAGNYGSSVLSAAMTPDGHYVAFIGKYAGATANNLYVWNSLAAAAVYTNTTSGLSQISISANGQRIAYNSGATLAVVDLANPSNNATIGSGTFINHWGWNFSTDGNLLVFETTAALAPIDVNTNKDIYLYDVLAKTNLLISRNLTGTAAGNGSSDSPVISPDSRFVAYRSAATNLVAGDSNGVPDVFLYDRNDGSTTLLTASQFGNRSGDNRSLYPFFSGDSQSLVFQSSASDLAVNDANRTTDLFAVSLYAAGMIPNFYVSVGSSNQIPNLSWPVLAGKTYQVQFKNSLADSSWQTATGELTILRNTAYFSDASAPTGQRFYQVVGF